MAAPVLPRLRVTASPGWEVVPAGASPRRAEARAVSGAPDPFVARVLATTRLTLAHVRSARPRRGVLARDGLLTAEVEETSGSAGWVAVARHASGALTFHPADSRAAPARRFEVRLPAPPAGRRGAGSTTLVFFLRVLGAGAGALLPVLARLWEKRRFRSSKAPLGLVALEGEGGRVVARRVRRPSLPPPPARSLLFVHGTFSHAAAAFADLAADPTLFAALKARYGGRVFAFNHLTVGTPPAANVRELLARLPRGPALLDAVTHSRGGLVLRALADGSSGAASSASRVRLGRVFLAASPNEGTPLASPARWHALAAWLANLGEMFPQSAPAFGLDFASEALVWLARRAGGALPGVAAMDPAGEFLEELNAAETTPFEAAAAVARYEPRGEAARRLLDAATGVFFEDPNDLVVPTEGGTRLGAAPPVPEARIARFGPGDAVHHLNLFAQRETKEKIRNFLEGEEEEGAGAAGPEGKRRGTQKSGSGGRRKRQPPSKHARSASSLPSSAKYSSSSSSPHSAPSARGVRRFELVLVGGKGGTPAHLLASFAGARVVEPFETKGGVGGERMRRIIEMHERILSALEGGGSDPLPAAKELRAYGTLLFETLFPGTVRRLWDEARSGTKGMLELVFTPGLDWIADKPWELAWDASRRRYLADDAILVRSVFGAPGGTAPARAPARGALHVLVALAEPRDAAPLAGRRESAAIRAALAPLVRSSHVRLEVLAAATPANLHKKLSGGGIDVLHFVGHGGFDAEERSGSLFLLDARGRALAVDTDRILRLLVGRGLKLVFLNACETGRGGRTDFLRGVAPALLAGGVPAVLANQYKVLDSSATAFARHLYWGLARGHTLGAAAREARVAVSYAKGAEPMDWAVPVLYARDTSLVFRARPRATVKAKPPRS